MKTLFIGGIKSGKSAAAERYCLERFDGPLIYLATAEAFDDEMRERVARHRRQRDPRFRTFEVPLALAETLAAQQRPVLIDCVTLWLNNLLHYGRNETEIFEALERILSCDTPTVFVLNDVGAGIVPDNPLARRFADLSGRVAQRIAAGCDEVYHCVAGIPARIKG